jgi:hypothetical protein
MSAITVTNLVSGRTLEALVAISFEGKQIGQLDVAHARQLAQQINECAAVAETEALLIGFLVERIGVSIEQAGAVLADFRAQRRSAPDPRSDHDERP